MYFIKTHPEEEVSKKEKKEYNFVGRPFARILSLKNRVLIKGLEYRVAEGPNIIIASHGYEWDDIVAIIRAYSRKRRRFPSRRQVYFAANEEIYFKDKCRELLEKNIKMRWGDDGLEGRILGVKRKNIVPWIVKIVTSIIAEAGSIPVDIRGKRNSFTTRKLIMDYLRKGRVVGLVQYYSKSKHESETPLFIVYRGCLKMALDLYEREGVNPSITLFTAKKQGREIRVNIAPPEFISDYRVDDDFRHTIAMAKESFEKKLERLYHEF